MFVPGRKLVHSGQAPFFAGAGRADLADLAAAARNAWASMDKVMCRYQAR